MNVGLPLNSGLPPIVALYAPVPASIDMLRASIVALYALMLALFALIELLLTLIELLPELTVAYLKSLSTDLETKPPLRVTCSVNLFEPEDVEPPRPSSLILSDALIKPALTVVARS